MRIAQLMLVLFSLFNFIVNRYFIFLFLIQSPLNSFSNIYFVTYHNIFHLKIFLIYSLLIFLISSNIFFVFLVFPSSAITYVFFGEVYLSNSKVTSFFLYTILSLIRVLSLIYPKKSKIELTASSSLISIGSVSSLEVKVSSLNLSSLKSKNFLETFFSSFIVILAIVLFLFL